MPYSTGDSWVVQILPFFEQGNLLNGYTRYSPSTPSITWQSPVNAAAVASRMAIVECPTSPVPNTIPIWQDSAQTIPGEYGRSDYFAVSGVNANAFQAAWGVAPGDTSGIFGTQVNGAIGPGGRPDVHASHRRHLQYDRPRRGRRAAVGVCRPRQAVDLDQRSPVSHNGPAADCSRVPRPLIGTARSSGPRPRPRRVGP